MATTVQAENQKTKGNHVAPKINADILKNEGRPQTATKISARQVSKIFSIRNGNGRNGNGTRPSHLVALEDITLDVNKGELLVIVGPSGCGKSTLLDLVGGLSQPTSGELLLDGKLIDGPGLDRGIVFQQYALFPWRTALGNIEFGLEAKGVPKRERGELARSYLSLVGLTGFEDRHPYELSGGMRQRVAIARSLAFDPDVLLMDEPYGAIDAQSREILQCELLRIWEKSKKTILFITHSIDEAIFLGQRVAIMTSRPGKIKQVVDIPLPGSRHEEDDLKSTPEFIKTRHEVWSLLREEVFRAQGEELCASRDTGDPSEDAAAERTA